MKYSIGHLAYSTADMAATLDFYVGKLNFVHAFSIPNNEGKPWIEYLMAGDGRFIEFFHPETTPHSAERVNIRVQINRGKDKNYQAWIRDPDGRDIELMQLDPDSPQSNAKKSI